MSVLVTALCNQPEAFASDLGYDQSHYLCWNVVTARWAWWKVMAACHWVYD